jgi:hypothetical protein
LGDADMRSVNAYSISELQSLIPGSLKMCKGGEVARRVYRSGMF